MRDENRELRVLFKQINRYPFLLLLLFLAYFFIASSASSQAAIQFGSYFLMPVSFAAMLFNIAILSPARINIWGSPLMLLVALTSYVFLAEATVLYNLWFFDTWGMFLIIPLGLLLYSIYMKLNRHSSAYYSGWNMLLVLLIPVLIFITILPCGYVPEWIPWTPFWQNVTTGPCL